MADVTAADARRHGHSYAEFFEFYAFDAVRLPFIFARITPRR